MTRVNSVAANRKHWHNCSEIKELLTKLLQIIDPQQNRTLSEEEILYHEGRIKSKKKEKKLIAIYKHTIWTIRAKLYYGEITRNDIKDSLKHLFESRIK